MLKPKQNLFIFAFFKTYILWLLKRHYKNIFITPLKTDPEKPVLLLANHFTWWDGFLLWYVNRLKFKRRFHVMILEKTLKKQGFMRYIGGYSVPENGNGIIASLRYTAGLLTDKNNLVLLYPQGKIHSNFVDEIGFKKGLGKIMRLSGTNFQYVFAAVFTENLQRKKPSVWVEMETHPATAFSSLQEVEQAFNRHYYQARKKQAQYEA